MAQRNVPGLGWVRIESTPSKTRLPPAMRSLTLLAEMPAYVMDALSVALPENALNARSGRYTTPPGFAAGAEGVANGAMRTYDELSGLGVAAEQCRGVLPAGLTYSCMLTVMDGSIAAVPRLAAEFGESAPESLFLRAIESIWNERFQETK
jgi:hypothetical protein